jgi:hypothetical protein
MSEGPVLILSPAKAINRLGQGAFDTTVPSGSYLITSGPVNVREERLSGVAEFVNYATNDAIPAFAAAKIDELGLRRVVVVAECDVLRAAELRERKGLVGMWPDEAVAYRDKVTMKQRVRSFGIKVAPFRSAVSAFDIWDAATEFGYPFIVKPPQGRGSSDVALLRDTSEVDAFLSEGPFSDRGRTTEWLVEKYIAGSQYRVDGVYNDGAPVLIAAAKYVSTNLDYLGGGYLGSVMLPPDDALSRELVAQARRIVERALPPIANGGFHLEAFHSESTGMLFSEVGARIGGGSIPEEIEAAYGVNVVIESIRAQIGGTPSPARDLESQPRVTGQLHVSPHRGRLAKAPIRFDHPAVVLSEIAPAGQVFGTMNHTNEVEFARAVFKARSVDDGERIIAELINELSAGTTWES